MCAGRKLADTLKIPAKNLRRMLRISPIYQILRCLHRYGFNPKTFSAPEVFGGTGQNHTRDIASVVQKLDIWELRSEAEAILKRKFPKSVVKITDSYQEITRTPNRYDLVVVDNFKKALNHYEHFDLFPAIFRVLNDSAVIILNITPKVRTFDPERMQQRQIFYNTISPSNISFDQMRDCYRLLALQNGWTVDHFFTIRRWTFSLSKDKVYYAALVLHSPRETNEGLH